MYHDTVPDLRARTLHPQRQARPLPSKVAAYVMVLLAVFATTACEPTSTTKGGKIVWIGDSLTNNSRREIRWLLGDEVSVSAFPGGALCWYFSTIKAQAKTKPEVIVLQSAGNANAYNTCVLSDAGEVPTGTAYLEQYASDLRTAVAIVKRYSPNTKIVVVGVPPLLPDAVAKAHGFAVQGAGSLWASSRLDLLYRVMASELGYTYVDAAKDLRSSSGGWVETMPCLPQEPCTGHSFDPVRAAPGRNIVRSPDGLHLCPVQVGGDPDCPVFSSGSLRFVKPVAAVVRSAA